MLMLMLMPMLIHAHVHVHAHAREERCHHYQEAAVGAVRPAVYIRGHLPRWHLGQVLSELLAIKAKTGHREQQAQPLPVVLKASELFDHRDYLPEVCTGPLIPSTVTAVQNVA